MMPRNTRPIVIAAGGTGGHFFPAEALAADLLKRDRRVVLMTDQRRAQIHSDVFANSEKFIIRGAGIAGRGIVRAACGAAGLLAGIFQARGILARLRPSVVVGFGGYPAFAPLTAACLLRPAPPVVLHEQNAVLGRANRVLACWADRIALSFAETARLSAAAAKKTALTGNPVRPEIGVLAGQAYDELMPDAAFHVLVLGGSLGARVFSDVVPVALTALPAAHKRRLRVVQQCRAEDIERVRKAYAESGILAELAPFFGDIAVKLAGAHLVIARAGASTVAELAAVGRPSILVPLPHAIDDHQTANARALAHVGGAWLIPQPEFTAAHLAARLEDVLADPAILIRAAQAALRLGRVDAAKSLADLVLALAQQEIRA